MFDPSAIPSAVWRVAEACHEAGGRAFLIGGSVRDLWLSPDGLGVKDWDLEVYGLPLADLERCLSALGRVHTVGRSFGVLKLSLDVELDIAIPRRDSRAGRRATPTGDPTMHPADAVTRRDLTINAILYDLTTQSILDPSGGLEDLRDGLLREVDAERFLDDSLRALRVVQFAARFGFRAAPSLIGLCTEADLGDLPPERVEGEWRKLMLKGKVPSVGLGIARQADLLGRAFPERTDDPSLDEALDRLALRRATLAPKGKRYAAMLALWLHASARQDAVATLDRLRVHSLGGFAVRDTVLALLDSREHPVATDPDLRRLSTRVEVALALEVRAALEPALDWQAVAARATALGVLHHPPTPLLRGRDLVALGSPPGPRMGDLLRDVYAAQLAGTVTTKDEALAAARAWLSDPGSGA